MSVDDTCPSIAVIAMLPPPVHGQTLVTGRVVEALRAEGRVRLFDWSVRNAHWGLIQRAVKGLRSLWSAAWLLVWRMQGESVLYSVANGSHGMLYNIVIVSVARAMGFRCVLHHHNFSYIARRDRRMQVIDQLMGRSGVHVLLSEEMARRFRDTYSSRCKTVVLPNYFMIKCESNDKGSVTNSVPTKDRPFRVGHISNLCTEKGLDTVIGTFEALHAQLDHVLLVLAGPLLNAKAKSLVDGALERYGQLIDYRGPVYENDKDLFFRDIDVMVYPTRNDAQPLVILESFAHGVPVIASACGCIPSMIDNADWLVRPNEDFVDRGVRVIGKWYSDRHSYKQATVEARNNAISKQQSAKRDLTSFAANLVRNTL